jgi:hypothetical protein
MSSNEINQVFCIGPFNSGTNLLQNILSNAETINMNTNQNIRVFNKRENDSEWINSVHLKHCFLKNVLNKYIHMKNMGVIVLYKNVYNWIYSIKKEPYEFKFINNKNKLFSTLFLGQYKFNNIIQAHNLYYTMYMDIIEKNSNVIFVDYYKLINNETSFDYLNQKLLPLGIKINNREKMMKELNKPAKNHGLCIKNSNLALQNYVSNQELVKQFVIQNTNLNRNVNTKVIKYFENEKNNE